MSQAHRLAVIARVLGDGQTVTSGSLQERFEVSRATIMRDIAYLRDRNGMPIIYDPLTRGFKLTKSNRFDEDVVALPGLWLTQDEAYALLTLFNIARQLDPGIFSHFIAPLKRPIKRVLGDSGYNMLGFDRKVRIDVPFGGGLPFGNFSLIGQALLFDKSIYIEARNDTGVNFSGTCIPQAVVLHLDGWSVEVKPDDAKKSKPIRIPLDSVHVAKLVKVTE